MLKKIINKIKSNFKPVEVETEVFVEQEPVIQKPENTTPKAVSDPIITKEIERLTRIKNNTKKVRSKQRLEKRIEELQLKNKLQ